MKLTATVLLLLSVPLATEAVSAAQMPDEGATALVIFGADTIRAEVARSPEERQRGLMFRNDVPEGTGMLFIFDRAEVQGIWMKDTYVPLDVAFLDSRLTVLNVEALEPLDLTTRQSRGPALLALEVRQGWFADHGVQSGAQARIELGRR